MIFAGMFAGFIVWFLVRYLVAGLYTVQQNERAVKTSFGRAQRLGDATTQNDPISEALNAEGIVTKKYRTNTPATVATIPHISIRARRGSPSRRASQFNAGIVNATRTVSVRMPDHASNAKRSSPTAAPITITRTMSSPLTAASPSPDGPKTPAISRFCRVFNLRSCKAWGNSQTVCRCAFHQRYRMVEERR